MNAQTETQAKVLMIGMDERSAESVATLCKGVSLDRVASAQEFSDLYEKWQDGEYSTVFCGTAIEGLAAIEIAQVLLNQCPTTPKYFVTYDASAYEPRLLLKNGVTACFAMPMDGALLKQAVIETAFKNSKDIKSYKTVKVLDLDAGDKMEFDTYVYMPLNKKHVRFTSSGQTMDAAKMDKLKSKQMSQLWIDQKELSKFYKFTADKMRALGEEGASATEKQQKLKDNVRTLFGGIFDQSVKADFDGGKEMIKQCEGIISNYITKGASSNWYQKILSSIGETADGYDHASNVATFAAMFAIGIGHKTPEDLAMAGLFHDIGLSQLPQELQNKKESELTAEEKQLYYTHIEKSLNMVKAKRIIIPDRVEKAISQHHEHWSGRGFPKQLPAGRISREAQLLCFADQFDHLTCFEEGKQRLSPMQAFEEIKKNGSIDPDLLAAIRPLLAG